MTQQDTTQAKPFFDALIEMTEDDAKKRQFDLARRKLQRAFQSAYDDAQAQILAKETDITNALDRVRKNPTHAADGGFNVNNYIAAQAAIRDLSQAAEDINRLHEEWFGEPYAR